MKCFPVVHSLTSGTNQTLRKVAAGILGNHVLNLAALCVCTRASITHVVTANVKKKIVKTVRSSMTAIVHKSNVDKIRFCIPEQNERHSVFVI